jgi:DNA repair photolyase
MKDLFAKPTKHFEGGRWIYQPKGRAREYAALAVNTHQGCPSLCSYCFVQAMPFLEHGAEIVERKGLLAGVAKDAAKLAAQKDGREILLSFICDPYPHKQPQANTTGVVRTILEAGLNLGILSKGGLTSLHDLSLLALYKKQVRVGASLTLWKESTRREMEPGAAPAKERIKALAIAKEHGLRTWASIEPVLYPYETISVIATSARAVDQYNIGWLNHVNNPRPDPKQLPKIVDTALRTGARVCLKRDAYRILLEQDAYSLTEKCGLLFEKEPAPAA